MVSEPQMLRTRASVSSGRGEAFPELVVENLARGRGRTRASGRARGITPVKGHAHGVPPEFGAPLFQETLLRMLGVLENLSQDSAIDTPQGAQMRVWSQTQVNNRLWVFMFTWHISVPAPVVGAQFAPEERRSGAEV
ncbi:hypothetical protein KY284_010708 [Solanum tuberosum]|nr:hypothetical protein KY284_010708 [Solanum tuberosum]